MANPDKVLLAISCIAELAGKLLISMIPLAFTYILIAAFFGIGVVIAMITTVLFGAVTVLSIKALHKKYKYAPDKLSDLKKIEGFLAVVMILLLILFVLICLACCEDINNWFFFGLGFFLGFLGGLFYNAMTSNEQ